MKQYLFAWLLLNITFFWVTVHRLQQRHKKQIESCYYNVRVENSVNYGLFFAVNVIALFVLLQSKPQKKEMCVFCMSLVLQMAFVLLISSEVISDNRCNF